MRDSDHRDPTPQDEDPVLHGHLAGLPAMAPEPGFDDRVLARVRRPAPRWITAARHHVAAYRESGQVWFLIGALALGSLIPWLAFGAFAAAEPQYVSSGMRWLTGQGWPELAASVSANAAAAERGIGGLASQWLPTGFSLTAGAAIASAIWLLCAVGLYRVMRPRRR